MAIQRIDTTDLSDSLSNTITQAAQGGGIPKIISIDYPGDDTAADPAGGQTIIINGSNFTAQSVVYLAGNPVSPLAFINATALSFTAPAQTTGVYSLYVVNSDGGTAIAVPGLLYSGLPTWSTASGSVGSVYETSSVSVNLEATGDGNVAYTVSAGNTIPTGLTLNSNGLLTGTVPATDPTTTYTFSVDAVDEQNQETARSFSITFLKDEVTWSSPANGTSYSWGTGVANSIALSSTSAAGKNITYSLQSGSLPANVSISGTNITGTPNTIQSNTSAIIRATAADTLRYADRHLYFTIAASNPDRALVAGGNISGGTTTSIEYYTISTTGNGTSFGDLSVNRVTFGSLSSSTRAIFGGGNPPGYYLNTTEYVTIASLGNGTNFGNLIRTKKALTGGANSTRGCFFGGSTSSLFNDIDYCTIATTGSFSSFGTLSAARESMAVAGSPTRALIIGGFESALITTVGYITFATTGNQQSFGNLSTAKSSLAGCSSSTRAVVAGGYITGFNLTAAMDYFTIASLGSSTSFGNLGLAKVRMAGNSNAVRGTFAGGYNSGGDNSFWYNARIDYITIASTGNSALFGNLITGRESVNQGICSSAHGGLQ